MVVASPHAHGLLVISILTFIFGPKVMCYSALPSIVSHLQIWEQRPLSDELLKYASIDVKYLHQLQEALMKKLPQQIMLKVSSPGGRSGPCSHSQPPELKPAKSQHPLTIYATAAVAVPELANVSPNCMLTTNLSLSISLSCFSIKTSMMSAGCSPPFRAGQECNSQSREVSVCCGRAACRSTSHREEA